MGKFTIGLDFGTLSVRGVLVNVENGCEVAVCESAYKHKVFAEKEVNGAKSLSTTALQNPQDYIDGFGKTIKDLIKISRVNVSDVVGVCIDFTSCTVVPVTKDLQPLCELEKYKTNPHAYVKLWKHHGANEQAEKMTQIAKEQGKRWLDDYGGKISSEWLFPKMLEVLENAPNVYKDAAHFLEVGDYLVWKITGKKVRSCCMAGFKGLWNKNNGYPDEEYFEAVNPDFKKVIEEKLTGTVLPVGEVAGTLNEYGAQLCGLNKGTCVCVPIIDAHAALSANGVVNEGNLMIIAGTSACHIVLSRKDVNVKGICGKVWDSVVPNMIAYEAGQSGFGDIFDWFINNCLPAEYVEKAKQNGDNIYDYLNKKANAINVGESKLIALDWWNGNRTPYADYGLSGMICGLNLSTKPEHIYRAILESVAFGTKRITELYEKNGIAIDKITVSGGIANKNGFFMQMLSDVLGVNVLVPTGTQAGAKGCAIYAAVASGIYDNLAIACDKMAERQIKTYTPDLEKTKAYQNIYNEYLKLSEYFAKENTVMKNL